VVPHARVGRSARPIGGGHRRATGGDERGLRVPATDGIGIDIVEVSMWVTIAIVGVIT